MVKSNLPRYYEFRVVALIFFAWGFIFLDRTALSYIIPSMLKDLPLTTGQIGQINMWQTIGFAVAGALVAMISDKTGKRKSILIASIVATSILSALSAMANSYNSLLLFRFLVGACEGPVLPLAMSMVAAASAKGTFGRNAGIVNAGVGVIAFILGPVLVTQIILLKNWHWAFVLISVPSLVLGVLIWMFTREVKSYPVENENEAKLHTKYNFLEVFKYRNVVVSMLIAICFSSGYWILMAYTPLYLTSVGQLSLEKMGYTMSAMGLLGIVAAIGIPLLSDHIGRKKVSVIFPILGILAPLGLYFFSTGWGGIASFILFGPMLGTMGPIFMNIIPEESVPVHLKATASSLIIGIGEITGALILGVAGMLANSNGLSFVLLVSAAAAFLMGLLGFGLLETNSRKAKIINNEIIKTSL